jgi:hypothetical protein
MEVNMSEKYISLKEADRKVFSASFDDGLVDIFISGVVLMFAVAPFLSVYLGDFWSSAIFLPFWGILFLVLRWIRINMIKPRGGVVKYGPSRRRKLTLFTGIMLVLNITIFTLALVVGFALPNSPGWTVLLPFSAMVLVLFSLAGFFLDVNRFYAYGLMLAAGPFIGEWLFQNYRVLHHGYPVVFGIYAGIIFLIGLIKLLTFLKNNPLPGDEQMHLEANSG